MFEPLAYAVPLEGRVERNAADRAPGPDVILTEQQAARIVATFAATLTRRQFDVIVLRYYREATFEDIGRNLGISAVSAHLLHKRALLALRKRLQDIGVRRLRDLI